MVPASTAQVKQRYLRLSVGLGALIATAKFLAYWVTGSAAILTDAAEGIVNVFASSFALYAVWLSARPPDKEHPYGHGKIEFVSAGFEGGFIAFAGLGILYEAYQAIAHPGPPEDLGLGLWLVAAGMIGNGFLGWLLMRGGKKHHSLALTADGKHLFSDALSSVGLLLGLGLMSWTRLYWLDGVIALILAAFLLYHGGLLIRESLKGLLDERDTDLLQQVAQALEQARRESWVDLHNLRAVRHGPDLHIDAHITLPWYFDLRQIETELKHMETVLDQHFQQRVEVFLHPEACQPPSCPICGLLTCPKREAPFQGRVSWTSTRLQELENHQPPATP